MLEGAHVTSKKKKEKERKRCTRSEISHSYFLRPLSRFFLFSLIYGLKLFFYFFIHDREIFCVKIIHKEGIGKLKAYLMFRKIIKKLLHLNFEFFFEFFFLYL